jgi:acetyl esterase/lipase
MEGKGEVMRANQIPIPALCAAVILVALRLAAPLASRGAGLPKASQEGISVRKDVAYYEGPPADRERHQLDLYLPAEKDGTTRKGYPLLLFIHGGAWVFGNKNLYGPLAENFCRAGIGVAVANYRLSPGVQHPEHEKDVARAFAWLVHHAGELGADPNRLFVSGHSAGAHLVALLALDPRYLKAEGLTPHSIRGVIGISGPYIMGPTGFEKVFGNDPAKRAEAFPLNHLQDVPAKELPRFLILSADGDYPGLPACAKLLEAGLRKQGVPEERHEIPDRDHISIIVKIAQENDPTAKYVIDFVKRP